MLLLTTTPPPSGEDASIGADETPDEEPQAAPVATRIAMAPDRTVPVIAPCSASDVPRVETRPGSHWPLTARGPCSIFEHEGQSPRREAYAPKADAHVAKSGWQAAGGSEMNVHNEGLAAMAVTQSSYSPTVAVQLLGIGCETHASWLE